MNEALPKILRDISAGRRNEVGDFWSLAWCDEAADELETLQKYARRWEFYEEYGPLDMNRENRFYFLKKGEQVFLNEPFQPITETEAVDRAIELLKERG